MNQEVVLTGLRSNSDLHLGNYLGAILPIVNLQKKHAGQYRFNMFIPDLHSFTTPIDHTKLYRQTVDNLKVFVAGGLNINDPNTYVYRQSYIPAHSELAWILDCFSYFGELSRMVEFKEKSQSQENVSVGLFNYPVLMAADILLHNAKWIPVGEDQRQHVEFARNLSIRMNNKFGSLFVVPESTAKQAEFTGQDESLRIRSLKNPDKKMSKSIQDPAGTIMLNDNPEEAAAKVMSATTDSVGKINWDWDNQPGITNLLQIQAALDNKSQAEINSTWVGKSNYSELKTLVAETVRYFLADFQENLTKINEESVLAKLNEDESKLIKLTAEKLLAVQRAVGLRPLH